MKAISQIALVVSGVLGIAIACVEGMQATGTLPIHFAQRGLPDTWVAPWVFVLTHAVIHLFVTAVFLAIPKIVHRMPLKYGVNFPRRDYWLAPNRRATAAALSAPWFCLLGIAFNLFLLSLHYFVRGTAPGEIAIINHGAVFATLAVFSVFLCGWTIVFWRTFANRAAAADRDAAETSSLRDAR